MNSPRTVLTPDALSMLEAIAKAGSFAAAARDMGMVPSALTYRVRQLEDALDVLLFDRSSRQARLTAAGQELLREGQRLLADMDAVANRIRRVATGWESQLTLAVDSIIDRRPLMELCEAFFALNPPTRLKLRDETLQGTLHALKTGQADLALGIPIDFGSAAQIRHELLGSVDFVFAVAPHHPLAAAAQPLSDAVLREHRAVAVADSVPTGPGLTIGLLAGQDVFTVPNMQAKLDAQLRGLGAGFLPEPMARPYLETGRLVACAVDRTRRQAPIGYAWRLSGNDPTQPTAGKALSWWLSQLGSPVTRAALLGFARQPLSKGVESPP